ncbi:hemolysin family protein [Cryomorphaceae bacterium 1068]|nr:hemolysin family protein [Cryomorphaceae bacterium 1068]
MGLLITFFLLSIIISFLCSIWEAVLLSITPSFVRRSKTENPSVGELISELKEDIDKPLSAILTLNTIAHTVGAIGVGAQAGELYGDNSFSVFGFGLSYESIIASIMTLAILLLSEIIPKTLGANNWRSLAGFTAKSVNALIYILSPFVWLSKLITKSLNKGGKKSVFSRGDFEAMADAVEESGEIEQTDHILIKNVLAFDELTVEDVMTPRTVMVMANESDKLSDFYKTTGFKTFSRFPVYVENRDHISGMVLKDDLLTELVENNGEKSINDIKREIVVLPDSLTLRAAFHSLNKKRGHMAVVVDEHGSLRGLITLEDIFETLFGMEFTDESDSVEDLRKYARNRWEKRAKDLGLIE